MAILVAIAAFNTFYAYAAAIDKLDETDISKKWIYVFIVVSILGLISLSVLTATK